MTYQPQEFTAPDGTTMVVLPKADFERLTGSEDAADIAAAKRALGDPVRYPASVLDDILAGATPLAALRRYRKLSQAQLAELAGMSQAGVARLERPDAAGLGTYETRRRLAEVLDVPLGALDPLAD